ncbi:MAG: hypothetical protein ACOCV1_00095 [Bacillota bacterium]
MALKDWNNTHNNKTLIVYEKNTSKMIIRKYPYPIGKLVWTVSLDSSSNWTKYFKTKQQALKFAKEYMRKH